MKIRDAVKLPTTRSINSGLQTIAHSPKAGATVNLAAGQAHAAKALVSGDSVERFSKAALYPARKAAIGDLSAVRRQVENLKSQLVEVNVTIKELMQQLQSKKAEEESVKDSIGSRADTQQAIMSNLQKAADALDEILRQTPLL